MESYFFFSSFFFPLPNPGMSSVPKRAHFLSCHSFFPSLLFPFSPILFHSFSSSSFFFFLYFPFFPLFFFPPFLLLFFSLFLHLLFSWLLPPFPLLSLSHVYVVFFPSRPSIIFVSIYFTLFAKVAAIK